jgi:hypothetical protein
MVYPTCRKEMMGISPKNTERLNESSERWLKDNDFNGLR